MPSVLKAPYLSSREKAKALLLRFGRNSLAWKILNPEMKLWFSRTEEGVIGYQTYRKTRVVAGAPVTRLDDLKSVIREFEDEASQQGETVCYFGAESLLADFFRQRSDHKVVLLGAQPVWNPQMWAQVLASRSSVAALIHYAERKEVYIREVSAQEVFSDSDYHQCLEQWMKTRKLPLMGFLVDPKLYPDLAGLRFFAAERNRKVIAFAVIAPIPGRNGWLIEHLIRGHGAVKGTSELLIHHVMTLTAYEGASFATLGLAPLSRCAGFSYHLNPVWMRAIFRWLYWRGAGLYSFNGLDSFKAKFKPMAWEPVYAIVNKPRFSFQTLYHVAGTFCRMPPVFFFAAAVARRALEWLE